MQILNVRFGLATNSSSSHSLIFLPEGMQAFDYFGERQALSFHFDDTDESPEPEYEPNRPGTFGWDFFTVASPEMKLRYLGVLLRDRLFEQLPYNIAKLVMKDWLDGVQVDDYDYIDHQSVYYLPSAFGEETPDEEFFYALRDYFLQSNLAILGGNDNDENEHPLCDGNQFTLPLPQDSGRSNRVCRYDSKYDFWTVFEPTSGSKIRFRLSNDPLKMPINPDKASAPELVDIKITNHCPFGCQFCYQSSIATGEHADYYRLYHLAHALGRLKVFEVALGGGEPTLHPAFIEILKVFREQGVVPNFTTKNLGWLRDNRKWPQIMKHCGAFAFSAEKTEQIHDLATLLDYNGIDKSRAVIHIVMGTVNQWDYRSMLKECNKQGLSTTLLGYKDFGFGKNYKPEKYDWWLKIIKELMDDKAIGFDSRISIDTAIASQYEKEILEAGLPRWMFHTEEGKFSCYIDAVSNKIGPSSFCSEDQMHSLTPESGNYVEVDELISIAFARF